MSTGDYRLMINAVIEHVFIFKELDKKEINRSDNPSEYVAYIIYSEFKKNLNSAKYRPRFKQIVFILANMQGTTYGELSSMDDAMIDLFHKEIKDYLNSKQNGESKQL